MGEPARVLEFKKKSGGFGDMLKQTAKAKAPASKKSKMPILDPPEDVRVAVDEYIDAKKREIVAKADKDMAETTIREFTVDAQDDDGYRGDFHTSYAVPGHKPGSQVKFVSSNRFSINANDRDKLEDMLGDKYPDMVDEEYTVKLKPEVFQDEEKQTELMDIIGDRFTEFFDTVLTLKVKENFNRNLYHVIDKDTMADFRTFCKPYKASLR